MEAVLADGLRYVAAEGVQGAGASGLAGLVARRLHARQVWGSPFPKRFDEDRVRRAAQVRHAFLVKRFERRKVIHARDLFHRLSAADFTFEKDRVRAHFCLAEDEIALCERLDRGFQQIRQRELRREPDPCCYADLHKCYTEYFVRDRKCPLPVIDAEDFHYVRRPEDTDEPAYETAHVRRAGPTYFRLPPRSAEQKH